MIIPTSWTNQHIVSPQGQPPQLSTGSHPAYLSYRLFIYPQDPSKANTITSEIAGGFSIFKVGDTIVVFGAGNNNGHVLEIEAIDNTRSLLHIKFKNEVLIYTSLIQPNSPLC